MLFLWYVSFLISFVSFVIGLFKRSELFMLISTVTFIPIAQYFFGVNNAIQYVGLIPFLLLLLTFLLWLTKVQVKEIHPSNNL